MSIFEADEENDLIEPERKVNSWNVNPLIVFMLLAIGTITGMLVMHTAAPNIDLNKRENVSQTSQSQHSSILSQQLQDLTQEVHDLSQQMHTTANMKWPAIAHYVSSTSSTHRHHQQRRCVTTI